MVVVNLSGYIRAFTCSVYHRFVNDIFVLVWSTCMCWCFLIVLALGITVLCLDVSRARFLGFVDRETVFGLSLGAYSLEFSIPQFCWLTTNICYDRRFSCLSLLFLLRIGVLRLFLWMKCNVDSLQSFVLSICLLPCEILLWHCLMQTWTTPWELITSFSSILNSCKGIKLFNFCDNPFNFYQLIRSLRSSGIIDWNSISL